MYKCSLWLDSVQLFEGKINEFSKERTSDEKPSNRVVYKWSMLAATEPMFASLPRKGLGQAELGQPKLARHLLMVRGVGSCHSQQRVQNLRERFHLAPSCRGHCKQCCMLPKGMQVSGKYHRKFNSTFPFRASLL